MKSSTHFVEVCAIPYCSEPEPFYKARMKVGLRIKELRKNACRLFEKQNDDLTLRDLKFAFLEMHPVRVNLGGDDHEVTVKKQNGTWMLSCNCRSWVFNLSGDRTCKHTARIETVIQREEERCGIKDAPEGGQKK